MKLNYITVMVRNMEKSLDFYEKLVGLKVMNKMEMAAGRIAFLSNGEGETMLEILEFADSEKVETRGMVMSYAAGESLEEIRARAEELGYSPSEITDMAPKPKYFTVLDPDGITVEFSVHHS